VKTVFLDLLARATRIPSGQAWDSRLAGALPAIPGFVAAAVRLRGDRPAPEGPPSFVHCSPLPEPALCELLDLGAGRAGWAATGDDAFHLPAQHEGTPVTVLIAPLQRGRAWRGEVILITRRLSRGEEMEYGWFLDHLARLLLHRSEALLVPRSATATDADRHLAFLHDTMRLLCQSNPAAGGPDGGVIGLSQQLAQEADLLVEILTALLGHLGLDHAFAVRRFSDRLTQVVVVASVDPEEPLPAGLREQIEDVFYLDEAPFGRFEEAAMVIRRIGRPLSAAAPPPAPQASPSPPRPNPDLPASAGGGSEPAGPTVPGFVHAGGVPCQVGTEMYGYLGHCTAHGTDLAATSRLLAMLANHLGFWFAQAYHLRQAEMKRDIQRKMNMTLSVLLSSVNLTEIVGKLVSDLDFLFGQKAGAVLLTSPETNHLEVFQVFGRPPDGFDLNAWMADPEVQKTLWDGVASEPTPEENPFIRMVFPLTTNPQQVTLLTDPANMPQKRLLGGIVLFRSPDNRPVTDDIKYMLTQLVNGVGAALLVALNYLEKLETIRALEGLMGKLSNADALFSEMIEIIRRLLKVTRISFLTLTPDRQHLVIRHCHGLPEGVKESTRIPIGDEISGRVVRTGTSLRLDNIEADERFQKRSLERYFNRSLLSVPLIGHGPQGEKTVLGVINVNNKVSGLTFTEQDQQLLEAIAHLVVAALETMAREEERRRKEQEEQRLQMQLAMAREVQLRLLPTSFPEIGPALEMAGRSEPAIQIGGDLYDGLRLDDGRWLAAIGDVSGKGMPAALLMATTRILLRSAANESSDPVRILATVNDRLAREVEDRFVTMQVVAIDPGTGEAEMASAGHGPLMARLQGKVTQISAGKGMPLGLMPGLTCQATRFRMQPGDAFLMFTDGLYEEKSPTGEMFGLARAEELFARHGERPAPALVEAIFEAIATWRAAQPPHDDLTVVAVTYRGFF
jgi:sigma-B regulation protein RsbU (phosphoserine phosphatase)